MALLAYEDSVCAGCGHPKSESMDPINEGRYSGHLYVCHACAAIESFKARFGDEPLEPGARISVTKS